MSMKSKVLVAASLVAAAVSATSVSAAVIVETTTNKAATTGGLTYATLNGATLGNSAQTVNGIAVSFSGTPGDGSFVQGSSGSTPAYSAPYTSNGNGAPFGQADGTDTSTYLQSGIGSTTLSFAPGVTYLGFLWGSIDTYNSLLVHTATGDQTYSGSDILTLLGYSTTTQSGQKSNYINFYSTSNILSITATSTGFYSFEIDNVAYGAVPEPAAWAMMMIGFGAVGFAMRRRPKATVRTSYVG